MTRVFRRQCSHLLSPQGNKRYPGTYHGSGGIDCGDPMGFRAPYSFHINGPRGELIIMYRDLTKPLVSEGIVSGTVPSYDR